jgi:hypothetical protein
MNRLFGASKKEEPKPAPKKEEPPKEPPPPTQPKPSLGDQQAKVRMAILRWKTK